MSPSAETRMENGQWNIPPFRRGVGIRAIEPVGNYAGNLISGSILTHLTTWHLTGVFVFFCSAVSFH